MRLLSGASNLRWRHHPRLGRPGAGLSPEYLPRIISWKNVCILQPGRPQAGSPNMAIKLR